MEAWRWREFLLLVTAFVFSVGFATGGLILLLIVALWEIARGEPIWTRTRLDPGLAGLVVVTVLSGLWSEWRLHALTAAGFMAISALVVTRAVVLSSTRSPQFSSRFIAAWAAGGVAASLVGIAGMVMTGSGLDARAQVPSLGYNALGTTLAIALVLLLGLSLDGERRQRLLAAMAMPVVLIGLVLTWSRGAWLGAVLGVAVLLARANVRRLWPHALVAVLLVVAAGPVLTPRWAAHRERVLRLIDPTGVDNRPDIWRSIPRIVADHPLLGTGLATFHLAYPRYALEGEPPEDLALAHNILLGFAAETGLAGLAALVGFLALGGLAIVRWHLRSPPGSTQRATSLGVLAAYVTLLGHQMVDSTAMGIHIAAGLYALMALGAAGSLGAGERAS